MKKLTDEDHEWIDNNRDWLKKTEEEWRMQVAKTQTDEYLIEAFPEQKATVVLKLEEYWKESRELYQKLKDIRNIVDHIQADTFSKWFYLKSEKYKEGKRLKWLQEQIKRLERLEIAYGKKEVEKHLSKEFFKTVKEREQYDIDKMFSREELLVDIASSYGIALRLQGAFYRGLCPFHSEKTPSFSVYKDNWAHCFGCNWHGNFIDFVMKYKNLPFREALTEINMYL